MPVPHPEQLVLFGEGQDIGSNDAFPNRSWQLYSYPTFHEFRAKQSSFVDIAANHSVHAKTHIILSGATPERVHIDLVSGNYFSVLQIHPVLGRVISEQDDQAPGAGTVVVASQAWFQHHLNGNPAAIGKAFQIQGHSYTLIGVAPPAFVGAVTDQPADLWVPLSMQAELFPGWQRAAATTFGATVFTSADEAQEGLGESWADVVLETVGGRAPTLVEAVRLARPGACIGMLGIFDGNAELPGLDFSTKELDLVGSNCYARAGARSDFDVAVALLAAHADAVRAIVTHRFPLADVNEAFRTAADKAQRSIKVTIDPSAPAGL